MTALTTEMRDDGSFRKKVCELRKSVVARAEFFRTSASTSATATRILIRSPASDSATVS